MDDKILAEQLVKTCLKRGADGAEVYLESSRQLSLEVRNGEIETVEEAATGGAGIRVFVRGRMAFSSSNDRSPAALENAAVRAIDFAKSMTSDPSNVLPDDKTEVAVEGLFDPEIAKIPLEAKVALIKTVEREALKDPRVTKSAGASYGEGEEEVVIANSNGLLKTTRSASCGYGIAVVAEKGEQKSSGGKSCSRRFFADLKKPEEVAAEAAYKAVSMLDPKPVKTQRAAVIFHPDVAGALLGGIIGAINGERVLQGASFLAKKVDQKIASDLVTLIDDGLLPKGLSSSPFDGEGVSTQKRTIVGRGVLKGFLYNAIVAQRAGVKSTGNGSRGGFTGLPGIGPHNFYLAAGTSKPEDIVRATKTGLWLREVTGYGINPVNGHFSGGAAGFWVENGRVAFPVKGLTVAGTAEEMLLGIDLVGDDLDLNRGTTAPTFRVKVLQVGGE
jgi:PmbA protein